MKIRLVVQGASLLLFCYLLWQTVFPLAEFFVPVDSFLRLDPLVATQVPFLVKAFVPRLFAGIVLIILTVLLGRFFCGYICPMGTTLDLVRKIIPVAARQTALAPSLSTAKYWIVCAITIASICGVNSFFWGSPIALITRFYALLIAPFLALLGSMGLHEFRDVFASYNMLDLAYLHITPRVYHTVYFVAAFFALLFMLEKIRPRFWCRYLCPAGAVLGLCSLRPLLRRKVDGCIECKKCLKTCPTGAITNNGMATKHAECIACRTCVDVCPTKAVSFSCKHNKKALSRQSYQSPLPSRRAFVGATFTGVGLAALSSIDAGSFFAQTSRRTDSQHGLIRPPGAQPEPRFLELCIRCGACMKACPSNGLQPTWLVAGFTGIFSPILQSRIGACEPECNVCGQVCPTGAIMALPLEDKEVAKIGTAVVNKNTCLAFAENKTCVVCQEVCPYGAVDLKILEYGKVATPTIAVNRCFGCGFCERHCPVQVPAITIMPLNELRLSENRYRQAAKEAGFDIVPVSKRAQLYPAAHDISNDQLPPGFVE